MSEGRHLLLVINASSLSQRRGSEAWLHQTLSACFEELEDENSVVLTAGAPGPDTWACEAAEGYGLRWVVYLRDGRRLDSTDDGANERRWSRREVDAAWHGKALVEAALKARAAGWRVRVLALALPGEGLGEAEWVAEEARKEGFKPERVDMD